jgi:membrane protease YdiL (CAAX protease family)
MSKLSVTWLWLAYVNVVLSSLVIGALVAATHGNPERPVRAAGISDFGVFAVSLHAIGTLIAVVVLHFLLKRKGLGWKSVGLSVGLSLPATIYASVAAVFGVLLFPLVEFTLRFVHVGMSWQSERQGAVYLNTSLDVILIVVAAVVIAPITEEIIYRGYVLNMFIGRGYRTIVVMPLSSVIFASIHIGAGPGIVLFTLLWGFIPAFLFLRFRTLYPCILVHALNNLLAWVVFPLTHS